MKIVTQQLIDLYLKNDVISNWLDELSNNHDEKLICQKWLRKNPAKRYIYETLYGDLLTNTDRLRVLDVGGGLTAFTKTLATKHDYTLVDLLAHDPNDVAHNMMRSVGRNFIFTEDWFSFTYDHYDLILANDLFPNVDQRLEFFLNRFLPQSSSIRTALTWYDTPRFYMTKRIDADELFCMLAWDSRQLCHVLKKYSSKIVQSQFEIFELTNHSVYPNGRQVCLVDFIGNLVTK